MSETKTYSLMRTSIDHLKQSIDSLNQILNADQITRPSKFELNTAIIKMDTAKKILSEELLHLDALPMKQHKAHVTLPRKCRMSKSPEHN